MPYVASLKNQVIAAAGRYHPMKGYDMLIEAFSMVAPTHPDWLLKIYGEGSLQEEYARIIENCHLEDQVVLESGTDKLMEKLSECSINVCSSNYEPFGMTIIEGFSIGIPCIATACDGPREIITDGYDGILVERQNAAEFAEAMEYLMDNEDVRRKMGRNALATFEKYDIDVIGKRFQDIVESHLKTVGNKRCEAAENEMKKAGKNTRPSDNILSDTFALPEKPIDYDELIRYAEGGRVGLKTIFAMGKKWMKYKLRSR